jgi:hypothetical protein
LSDNLVGKPRLVLFKDLFLFVGLAKGMLRELSWWKRLVPVQGMPLLTNSSATWSLVIRSHIRAEGCGSSTSIGWRIGSKLGWSKRISSLSGCSFAGGFMGLNHGEVSLEARLLLRISPSTRGDLKEREERRESLGFRDPTGLEIFKGIIEGLHQT